MLLTEVFQDHREIHICEYEIDSDDEESDYEEHLGLVNRACLCIRDSRLVTVSRNDSSLYDARDDLSITSRENNGTEKLGYVNLTKIIFRHWTLVSREVRKA